MSHTPGEEWEVEFLYDDNKESVLKTIYTNGEHDNICWITWSYFVMDRHEVEANAALIAAAPELLAACEAAHTLLEKAGGKSLSEWHAMVIEKLEAAVKKAKGTP